MKQSAVEWLFEQVVNRTERIYFLKELEQAKEMEKEQIVNGVIYGNKLEFYDGTEIEIAEQYFNKTYKSESFCNCPKGKGIDFDENQKAYCIDCGKNIINL